MSNNKNCVKHMSNIKKPLNQIEKYIYKRFQKKHILNNILYNLNIINNIIYNEKTHIVAKFKDYLIIDDYSEFLKRYYKKKESLYRLPKYYEYYEKYNKIFPNYTMLKESKYIYKNIHKKQKMIDLQQEMEEDAKEKKINKKEKSEKGEIKKSNESNHQRKRNKQDIIFNSKIYNSIIKQSEDLYSVIFGIDKNEDNDSSIVDINEITNLIDYYSKIKFNYNKELGISNTNYNNNTKINLKKNNNSSLLTKQSTINSSIHKKYKKLENLYPNNNDIIIGLKKSINNKQKSITSSSILYSNKDYKNELMKSGKKSLLLSKLIQTVDHSINKNDKKQKHLKLNINNQNYINFIKEKISKINSKYKIQIENKNKILTERRRPIHCKYKTLNTESNKVHYINTFINDNRFNNNIKINNSLFLNKKSIGKEYYTTKHSKNPSIQKHKKSNTVISESAKKPLKKKYYNKIKGKTIKANNNKMVINLKEIKKLMRDKKNKNILCQTERNSILNPRKIYNNKKLSLNANKINNDIMKKFSFYKTTNSSIDKKSKINKNILFSQKLIASTRREKKSPDTTPLQRVYKKINRSKIFQMFKEKIGSNSINNKMRFTKVNNSLNLTNYKRHIDESNDINVSTKYDISNNISSLKNSKTKNHNTLFNIGPTKNRIIINKIKNNFIIDKPISASRNKNI